MENNEDYKSIFFKMLNGFAIHQIVLDESGTPIDYIFLDVNPAFEKMTGLKKADIVGQKVTQVIPGIDKDPVNWIQKYGDVAIGGQPIEFENMAVGINKWFHVSAYSLEKGKFITIFEDITDNKRVHQELIDKNNKYEQIFKTVVDRELKMVELKEELQKLKNQN